MKFDSAAHASPALELKTFEKKFWQRPEIIFAVST
jgi:hypothetical protein